MIAALAIIFGCLGVGEIIVTMLGLKLPPSIIGLLLLFALLKLRWVRVDTVRPVSDVLLNNLMLLLIPACVSVMDYLDVLAQDFMPIVVSTIVSTLLVFWLSAKIHAWVRGGR